VGHRESVVTGAGLVNSARASHTALSVTVFMAAVSDRRAEVAVLEPWSCALSYFPQIVSVFPASRSATYLGALYLALATG
jgi:hypothetical protein